jgi:hypothetical protein
MAQRRRHREATIFPFLLLDGLSIPSRVAEKAERHASPVFYRIHKSHLQQLSPRVRPGSASALQAVPTPDPHFHHGAMKFSIRRDRTDSQFRNLAAAGLPPAFFMLPAVQFGDSLKYRVCKSRQLAH